MKQSSYCIIKKRKGKWNFIKMTGENLTDEQIAGLKSEFLNNISSFITGCIESPNLMPYFEKLVEYRVIDIGPGEEPINDYFKCKEFAGVQPFESFSEEYSGKYIIDDGLSHLRKQDDNSAVVVSFGVIDDCILNLGWGNKLSDQYALELSENIARVSSPFAILIGSSVNKFFGKPDVEPRRGLGERYGGLYSFDK